MVNLQLSRLGMCFTKVSYLSRGNLLLILNFKVRHRAIVPADFRLLKG